MTDAPVTLAIRLIYHHAPGAHDDIANAIAGLAATTLTKYGNYDSSYRWVSGSDNDDDRDGARAFRVARLLEHIQRYG